MIHWERPGYLVAFTTRAGGVSEGALASLNLGRSAGDEPAHVDENRRRACETVGVDPARLRVSRRQVHGDVVRRAGEDGDADGLWSDEPGEPLLALAADCVPIAIARTDGERRLAVVHAGWRGLAGGVVASAVAALGGETAAVVGPAIGPCCYEVGAEVAERFDGDLLAHGHLDLWAAAERRLREAGVASVERVDLCTACHPELFFSHRRDRGVTGRQGVIGAVA